MVAIRHSDTEAIASDAATVSSNRVDATATAVLVKPAGREDRVIVQILARPRYPGPNLRYSGRIHLTKVGNLTETCNSGFPVRGRICIFQRDHDVPGRMPKPRSHRISLYEEVCDNFHGRDCGEDRPENGEI